MSEVPLSGGISTPGIVRVDDTVRRPLKPDADYVNALLRHLERQGFDGAPRFLGIDEQNRAILTYIDRRRAAAQRPPVERRGGPDRSTARPPRPRPDGGH